MNFRFTDLPLSAPGLATEVSTRLRIAEATAQCQAPATIREFIFKRARPKSVAGKYSLNYEIVCSTSVDA
jgi:hypothetical protein